MNTPFSQQIFCRLQGDLRVHRLIASADRDFISNIFIIRIPPGKCNIFSGNFPDFERMIRYFSTGRASFQRRTSDDLRRLLITAVVEHRYSRLDDPRFLSGNLRYRIT